MFNSIVKIGVLFMSTYHFLKISVVLYICTIGVVKAELCGPGIGEKAPSFVAQSTKGAIHFPSVYKGKWVLFFSHPADFTPICETEFKNLASMFAEFKSLNTCLLGLSVDSAHTHERWIKNLEKDSKSAQKVYFPVISDVNREIARKYAMIHPSADEKQTVRSVYFIDPSGLIRAILHYPITNGRNFNEIRRLLIALQTTDKEDVITPANWQPGEDAIVNSGKHKDALPDAITE
jgi:peroxiredoxin 2/4